MLFAAEFQFRATDCRSTTTNQSKHHNRQDRMTYRSDVVGQLDQNLRSDRTAKMIRYCMSEYSWRRAPIRGRRATRRSPRVPRRPRTRRGNSEGDRPSTSNPRQHPPRTPSTALYDTNMTPSVVVGVAATANGLIVCKNGTSVRQSSSSLGNFVAPGHMGSCSSALVGFLLLAKSDLEGLAFLVWIAAIVSFWIRFEKRPRMLQGPRIIGVNVESAGPGPVFDSTTRR